MQLEQTAFALVTILIAGGIAFNLEGWVAKLAIIAMVLLVMYFGPFVFGRDWFHEGFIAGVIIGDFVGMVFNPRTAKAAS